MRHRLTLANVLVLALVIVGIVHAQDSNAVIPDKTGLFGAVIDHWFLPVVGAVQSGVTWVIAHGLGATWKKINVMVQWTILYGVGLIVSYVGVRLGWMGLSVTPEGLQALGVAGVLATFPTAAAGLIYRLGGHRVPEVNKVPVGSRG